ncbi:radical SAM protein [Streptomyces sp. NPDC059455]|uniref:radical SAM protein n=1 Tax=Streptomyces sp. NPDC059455 TaxID=3346837 RepID=UPI0036BCED81
MHVISAEDVAGAVCLLADGSRNAVPGVRDSVDAWRKRYSQRHLPVNPQRRQAAAGNCDPSPPAQGIPPITLWLELVESCNLDCLFCYNPWRPPESSLRDQPLLSPGQLQRILDRIFAHVPISHVKLSGGEPLLYPQINTLTRHVKQHCESIGMTTNGRSLTRRRLSALTTAGMNYISVPVHSHLAAVHDELAGARSWHAAVRALALSLEAGVTTTLSCVATRKNVDHIGAVAGMALSLGIGTIVLNCFHATGQGAGRKSLELTASEFTPLIEMLRTDIGDQAEIIVGSPPPLSKEERKKTINRITLSPFGELKLCAQSSSAVLNVQTAPDKFDAFLDAVSRTTTTTTSRVSTAVPVTDRHVPETQPGVGKMHVSMRDQCAIGVLAAPSRAGVAVADEVSVAGYDDDALSRLSCFSLTTVSQGAEEQARRVERLDEGRTTPREVALPPRLVMRGSTARAPSAP